MMNFDTRFPDSLSINIFWFKLAFLAIQATVFSPEFSFLLPRQSWIPLSLEM